MKKAISYILSPTQFKRALFFLFADSVLITASLYLSFLLRFEFNIPELYYEMYIKALPVFLIVKLFVLFVFGAYRMIWRYVDINELKKIGFSIVISETIIMVTIMIPFNDLLSFLPVPHTSGFPRSVFIIDAVISSLFIALLRLSKRLFIEISAAGSAKRGVNTIIIGAGGAGEMTIRDITKQGFSQFYPVAILDDDKNKHGGYIHGVKVVGSLKSLKNAIRKFKAEAVIIAIPSLNHKILKEIFAYANECGVKKIKVVPRIYDYEKPQINIRSLEDISIEDLIGRESVSVDTNEIRKMIKQKVVFISGSGGSIGSEIALQVCSFSPEKIILFDIDETELHNLAIKIQRITPDIFPKCAFITGDIRDKARLEAIFKDSRPDVVFHAAAYKHVPMMEANPHEAVKVNIFGTHILASVAATYEVSKFVLISTDKAVRPASVMGATKLICEYICRAFNDAAKKTDFISVRFGNVLGSRGSALPIFLDQLKHGGPITVTHPDMKRYFMTIPEAVSLVLQAAVIGEGGDTLALDMGQPVKIKELAEDLIRLHGLTPGSDVDIQYTGVRPGEKLFEELLTAEEGAVATRHKKIFIVKNNGAYEMDKVEQMLEELKNLLEETPYNENRSIRNALAKYINSFTPGQAEALFDLKV